MVASFRSFIITATLAVVANATVFPVYPIGGSETTGQTCLIQWQGDTSSPTTWQGMAIELMSGANLNMIHLTTVATNLDGTKDGSFNHTCPEVTINAPIYFYQLSSPGAGPDAAVWTTRFTIVAADGHTDPAPSSTQPPPGNEPTPWGYGELVNTATAVPQPTFAPDTSTDTPDDGSSAGSSPAGSSSAGSSSSGSAAGASTPAASSFPSSTGSSKLIASNSATPTGNASSNSTNTNAKSGSGAVGGQVQFLQVAAVLVGCAMGFAILL